MGVLERVKPWMEGRKAGLLVVLLAAFAALLGVFTLPALDRDEARFAQATAQMLESGDWIQIRFLDEARHKKPVGIHWVQAPFAGAFSEPGERTIAPFRLASVLGAMLAALAAFAMARALIGHRAAFAAGALFAVSVLLATEGGIAKTDAMLAGVTSIALLAIAQIRLAADFARDNRPSRLNPDIWAVIAWASVALGVLIKGPITPMVAGLGVLALVVWERRVDWIRSFFWWPGPLVAMLIAAPWFIAIQIATDGAFLREAIMGDLGPKVVSGHEGHGAPPGLHLALLSLLIFPSIVFLPAGLAAAISAQRQAAASAAARSTRILLALIVPAWLVFELAPTKLVHYTLPVYAPLAVLAGWGFQAMSDVRGLWLWLGAGLGLLAALLGAVLLVALSMLGGGAVWMAVISGSVVCVLAAGLAVASVQRRAVLAIMLAIAAGLSWHVGARGLTLGSATQLFLADQVGQVLQEAGIDPRQTLVMSTFTEPSLAFELGGAVRLVAPDSVDTLLNTLETESVLILDTVRFASAGVADDRPRAPSPAALQAVGATALGEVSGNNYSRGDDTTLLILHLDPPGDADEESP